MLLLLAACTGLASEDSTVTEVEDSEETENTDTATGTTETEPVRYEVQCEGVETYNATLALGWAPPAPVTVEVWGHHSDWWMAGMSGADPEHQIESWYLAPVQISESGELLLFCEYKNLTNIDPSYIGFTTDRYVVYVKPL